MTQFADLPDHVELVVVGSGPVGAAAARRVLEQSPQGRVLLVEVGPQLTDRPGENIRQLPLEIRTTAQHLSEGPGGGYTPEPPTGPVAARPGTFLATVADSDDDLQRNMPAAAMSSNVGGMGAHWTCACPRPGDSERPTAVTEPDFENALGVAETYLRVTQQGFERTAASDFVLRQLKARFDEPRPEPRQVQPMPLAAQARGHGLPHWTGVADVLGSWVDQEGLEQRLFLVADTLAYRLRHENGRVSAVHVRHLPTGEEKTIEVDAVVVAADAFRTPQLLWASDLRPPALGAYLNDQPQIVCAATLDELASTDTAATDEATDVRDSLTGVMWVPFHEPEHPFHGQVMQMDASPVVIAGTGVNPSAPVVGLGWFVAKEPRAQDRIVFSDTTTDGYGMPAFSIEYDLSAGDRAAIEHAKKSIADAASTVGTIIPGAEPRLLPAGSSLHYQGTVRMGITDDGESVCSPQGKVWGTRNLYVGGNGVIATATACNPTLTSVALAVLAADDLVNAWTASA